jgi:hypothetical protein
MRPDHFAALFVLIWGCREHTKMSIMSERAAVAEGKSRQADTKSGVRSNPDLQ